MATVTNSGEFPAKDSPTNGVFPPECEPEAEMSFGEPLHVSVTRGTSRFESIQQSLSRQATADDEEAAVGNTGSTFDLASWLMGRQRQNAPPFATRVGVAFDSLSVFGDNVKDRHIATLATPVWKLLKAAAHGFGVRNMFKKSEEEYKQLLHGMTGVVKDGEMLLVLGRPGSGCSTLLRVLGNRRKEYKHIDGSVSYGGLTPEEISKQYRGQVAYCAEDDDHYPMLTVKQTLEFAIDCKMPSRNMLEDRAGYKKEFLDALLEMYGLRSCADTVIGDSFTRGVSGGERKRVSIAEQMAAGASVDIWDGSTRGLDSSTALDFVRSLRITTDVLHKATVASIYQASEDIYKLFDKVLVVDKGRQLYFGPTSEAVAYFESLGIYKPARQTSADFLTGLTQLHERRVRPEFEGRVPETAEDFERVWIESSYHNALQEQVREFSKLVERDERSDAIRAFVARTKMGDGTSGLRRKSPYGTTFGYQLGRLLRRELNIVLGNRAEHAIVVFCYVAFAALVAVSFLRISDDSNSARIRGSLIFLILAFVALSEESGVAKAMTNRRVLAKHRQLAMYHPAALSLVQSLTDIPLVIVKCTLFAVVVYFATGLARSASHFFTFDLLLAVLCACMMAFFKLLGNFAPDIDVALTVSGVVLIFWVMLSNYLQTTPQMHPYFRWISYIDPLAYTFKALMANEFRDRQILCNGASMVPSGPGFDDIAHQVCTLQGARPGQMYVHGRDYLAEGLDIYVADRWKNFGAVAGFWGLFVCLGAIVVEFVHHGATSHSINIFKRRCPKVELVTEDLVPSCSSKNSSVTADKRPSGTTFTWKYVNYTVPVKNDERQLLDSVSGYIKPGTLTALMGSSGAGKTTLLDSLSQRKTVGRLRGEMLMDGMPLPRSFRRSTGYAEQLDVHASLVTVREALRFSAYLRQPASVPDSEKNSYVERVIYLLDLTSIADCLIGDPDSGEGISLEERKRLTIGIELVSKPKILFLDEPTSGLDAQASYKVVHLLRRLAAEGQTILCTIHQPSALLFEQFDRLLLLVRGGRAVYFGELGEDAQTLLQYFERNGAPKCSPTANPAEYILDVVSNPDIDWPQLWRDSPELASILVEIDQINQDSRVVKIIDDDGDLRFARSRWHQICLVTRRMFLMYWRNLDYQLTNAALQIISAIVIGLAYLNLSDSASDLLNKTYACFLAACLNIFITNQVLPEFIRQRQYFFRENATNQYGSLAFILASVITELPFLIVTCSLFFVCFYWTAGLNSLSERIGYFYISYIVLGIYSMTLGQGIASVSTSVSMATMISPIFTTVFALFAGILIPYDLLPGIWRYTLYWLSPYQYWLDGIITNELHNSRVHCRDSELFTFEPPSGMSCGAYAGQWVEQAIGYLHNPNATTACKYCQFTVGDQYFASLNWSFDHRWRNFGILFAFIAANIAITAVTIRLYKINKR